jgi:hypothetical protein
MDYIDRNLLLRGMRIRKAVLYVKKILSTGDFITTCCIGTGFDYGRAAMVEQITSKSV